MVCKNCGRQVVATDRFCPDCGTPVVVEEPVVETKVEEVAPVVEEKPAATKTTRARKTSTKKVEAKPEEKKSVTSSSLLQAISAARNNSKLANNEENAENVEKVNEEVAPTVEPETEVASVVETSVVETPVANTPVVESKAEPKVEAPVSNAPFVPTVTSTKQPKGFGIASIIISSIMMLALSFVIMFAVLLLTAQDASSVIGLILIGGVFALAALSPAGVVGLGVPSILSLVFAIIQTVKAKRKLSWIALILAILVVAMFVVCAVFTFVVDWNSAFHDLTL